jgi:tetratricopeptide (TPR) repeat protein
MGTGNPNTEPASNPGRIREAIASYEQAATLQPRGEAAWLGLIDAFGKAGHPDKAESACRSCLKWNPQSTDCQEQLARIRMEAGDFGEAIRLHEELREGRRGSKSVLDGLGYAYVQSSQWDKARTRLEESLRRFGPEAGTLRQLGFVERSLGKVDQAAKHYHQASELAPQDLDLRHDLAFTLYLQGDHLKAVGHLLSCLKARPNWGMAHYNLSLNYWHLRDYAAALRHARIAKDLGIIQAAGVEQALMPHLPMGKSRTAWIVRRK